MFTYNIFFHWIFCSCWLYFIFLILNILTYLKKKKLFSHSRYKCVKNEEAEILLSVRHDSIYLIENWESQMGIKAVNLDSGAAWAHRWGWRGPHKYFSFQKKKKKVSIFQRKNRGKPKESRNRKAQELNDDMWSPSNKAGGGSTSPCHCCLLCETLIKGKDKHTRSPLNPSFLPFFCL